MLHWEDFLVDNARRILNKYTADLCTFNDDMQGTAAVMAAAFAAAKAAEPNARPAGGHLWGWHCGHRHRRHDVRRHDQRRPLGTRGSRKILDPRQAGLLTDNSPGLRDFQQPYARPAAEVTTWSRHSGGDGLRLADVVANARPTMLIGTSTQSGAFTEAIARQMASTVERPIIMPPSNPTSKAEAVPEDLIRWTDARVLIATGSPFPSVSHGGRTYTIAQANNASVFPGLSLGVAVVRARRVSDAMIAAASRAVAELADASRAGTALLPPVTDLRTVSAAVAIRWPARPTRRAWRRCQ
jgi:malate dehydrogenase (oxaloacetate-decarboxylating)